MVSYAGARILVTGGTGFVGGRLAERLQLERRAFVRVLVRNWTSAVWVSRTRAELVKGEMTDASALTFAVSACDVVFHCASGGTTDDEYWRTNVDGTRALLEASHRAGVRRFVFVSSIAVHGPSPPDGASELDAYRSMGRGYSRSKIEAERLVLEFGIRTGLQVCIVRPTFVWGPRSGLFTLRPLRAMKEGTFRLVDDGRGDCHAVYIDHLVDLLCLAGSHPNAVGEAFLATDGFDITWRQFFEFYAGWLGIDPLPSLSSGSSWVRLQAHAVEHTGRVLARWQGDAPFWKRACRRLVYESADALRRRGVPNSWDLAKFARRGKLDASKAQRLLGHRSALTLDEAMRRTEQWVRDQMGTELGLGEHIRQES